MPHDAGRVKTVDIGPAPRFQRTRELKAQGVTDRQIRRSVQAGELIRLREGAFASAITPEACVAAGRARGRLACISELKRRGVFVLDHAVRHIHVPPTSSRLTTHGAAPRTGGATSAAEPARASGRAERPGRIHRSILHRAPHPNALSVEPFDAVVQAVQCQEPRAALATLDSAVHEGVLRADELDELFRALPSKHQALRPLVDGRAESGPETLMRLILRTLGCVFDLQVRIVGVGRVDFVVDGWLIVECDSEAHHATWEQQKEDHRRDQAAAAAGYAVHRVIAEDIMWRPDSVRAGLAGLLAHRCASSVGLA